MKTLRFIVACLALAAAASCVSNQAPDMNNPVIDNIMARRSIRQYSQEPVDREVMTKILECGINAPNGQNRQSWEVRVVDNPELMQEIKDENACMSLKDLALNGRDLMAMGYPAGKALGKALQRLLNAVIDDEVENTKEALTAYLSERLSG